MEAMTGGCRDKTWEKKVISLVLQYRKISTTSNYPLISTEIRPKFDRIPKDGPTRGKAKKWAYLMEKEKMAKKQCQKIEF